MKLGKILFIILFVYAASVCAKEQSSSVGILKPLAKTKPWSTVNAGDSYALNKARQDSRFVEFEKYFDVTRVWTRPIFNGAHCCVIAENYSVYATPKVEKFFENLSFRFDWLFRGESIGGIGGCLIKANTESFKESPIDEVKLYDKIKKSIYKNPSFAKWLLQESLRYKEESKNSYVARMLYEKSIYDGSWGIPVDDVWEKVGMFGKYVGTLQIGYEGEYRARLIKCGGETGYDFSSEYEFMLSDSGDILVSSLSYPANDMLLGVSLDKEFRDIDIRRCRQPMLKRIPSYAKHMYCNSSVASRDYCEKDLSTYKPVGKGFYLVAPEYCDYLIIRRNGKIEYGLKRRKP